MKRTEKYASSSCKDVYSLDYSATTLPVTGEFTQSK